MARKEPLDLETLRQNWQKLNIPISPTPSGDRKALRKLEEQTLTGKLRKTLRGLIWISVAGTLLSAIMFYMGGTAEEEKLMTLFLVLFPVSGVSFLILLHRVNDIDFGSLNMREALQSVIKLQKYWSRREVAGWIILVPVLSYIIYLLKLAGDDTMMWACVGGAIIGLVGGIAINIRSRRIIRRLREIAERLGEESEEDSSESENDL